ncbi:hypothetical protein AZL_e00680 (plasmid) [Azospirillum sp. B510]|nr:hypothetical protein [Azospirillum sp. B510]BAI76413.1 hypothetical protein AZL_e00680 [Azospirillum sp. B510]
MLDTTTPPVAPKELPAIGVQIGIEGEVRVLVAAKPVDFRKGMDGLTALMQQ